MNVDPHNSSMNNDNLKKRLKSSSLIAMNALSKLDLINFIIEGYESNDPIMSNNHFLFSVSNNFYKLVILDLHALYGKATKMNKWSFQHFIKHQELWQDLNALMEVQIILDNNSTNAGDIAILRDKEIAHQDLDSGPVIKFNTDKLDILNSMANDSIKIIQLIAGSIGAETDFDRDHTELDAVKELVGHER